MSQLLANTKQEIVTGGSVNYYLVNIDCLPGGSVNTVEIEDIIEFFDMRFSAGCVFKAVVRLCKLRQDLGKPGSTERYEAEKANYYSYRNLAITKRRMSKWRRLIHIVDLINDFKLRKFLKDPLFFQVKINQPRRLAPYSFRIADFILALKPTRLESLLLEHILISSYIRKESIGFSYEEGLQSESANQVAEEMLAYIKQNETTPIPS